MRIGPDRADLVGGGPGANQDGETHVQIGFGNDLQGRTESE
ncbi:Uncharacterised protein [Mycobacteroides abscessus subsp. abscessus]|nr:Uncharacterised protein [Mycobacteroides abscessus subsp. abscessus]